MEAAILAILKFLYDVWGVGFVVALIAIAGTVWVTLKAKTVLDRVSSSMISMVDVQKETNKIMLDQQPLCRGHAESQMALTEAMASLVQEVHAATTSGNRVQENNMRAVLELLERQMDRNSQTPKVQGA